MRKSALHLARSVRAGLIGLLLLAPAGADAQEPAPVPSPVPSPRGIASAGFAAGTLGYRLGTFEIVGGGQSGALGSVRFLVGSRPRILCEDGDSSSFCDERAGFAALLGGAQWVASGDGAEPYLGGQIGFYSYDGAVDSGGLILTGQAGLRLRIGSFGGVYGDVTYLIGGWGGIPIASIGLYIRPR